MTITITYQTPSKIKHIIIKKNNITLYYNSFNDLLVTMDLANKIHEDPEHPLTYIFDHQDEKNEKRYYHKGIDPSFSDEGHYHFERKDRKYLSAENVQNFLSLLFEFELLNKQELNVAQRQYRKQSSPNYKKRKYEYFEDNLHKKTGKTEGKSELAENTLFKRRKLGNPNLGSVFSFTKGS